MGVLDMLVSATLVLDMLVSVTPVLDTATASVRLRLSPRPMPTTVLTVLASDTADSATPVWATPDWDTPDTVTTARSQEESQQKLNVSSLSVLSSTEVQDIL